MMRTILLLLVASGGPIMAADWPQWRGPRGNGIADEKNLPERWSATENVTWNAKLSGLGVSSPIVSGDRVIVTSQIGAGVRRPGTHPRLAQGGAAATGRARACRAERSGGRRSHVLRGGSVQSPGRSPDVGIPRRSRRTAARRSR
jgi:hypothetical protein